MSNQKKIKGGYYLKARQIDDSAIAHAAPHVREVWDWLIKYAQHTPYKVNGKTIERGQVLTTYEEIANDLHWMVGFVKKTYKKHHIDFAMRWLRQELMITTQKTTRGFIVTICNYAFYQDPKNYVNDNDYDTITTPLRQPPTTINKNDNNDYNNEININRGEGDLQPLHATPPAFAVIVAADGSLVKKPAIEFKPENFNGLPENFSTSIIRNLKNVKSVEVGKEAISELWEDFKVLELHKKLYRSKEDVYSFFSNYCKKQTWSRSAAAKVERAPKKSSKSTKNEKITGVEWINNFTQCRMSDGTIQDLDINQQDSAKFNLISPSAIKR